MTNFDERELRRALAGHAATIEAGFDPARLQAAMVRVDRLRTLRAGVVVASVCVVALVGIFASGGRESASPLEVVDRPDLTPPIIDLPVLDDATNETSTTTTTAPANPLTPAPHPPTHLADPPPTTSLPAVVDTTTTAPAATVPPPTTAPPTTTAPPPTTTAATIAFSASARYGTCEEDPPYDEYSGTATPGATVTITSPWSATATAEADDDGHWFRRVEFPTSPVGETFTVTVSDGTSSQSFDFTRTA